MASWTPQDGTHAPLPGAPDQFCYQCSQFCGGTDSAGNAMVCAHCAAQGLPPAGVSPDDPSGDPAPGEPVPVVTSPDDADPLGEDPVI